eukprot:TRINITY_DN3953_c0_g1_i2.p1 TRINITY_DN3953_c0_g1~~TRINITY_DN3953_c0_g1_i2.p1  ORF type:complete len:255 (+),score=36.53 TRINITY_DN3953_c0_g1_i2:468-1232(+)
MNGPGTCVPISLSAFLLNKLHIINCKTVLMESFTCVHHFSLTAKILSPIVDLFLVKWPSLLQLKKSSQYIGRLPLLPESSDNGKHISLTTNSYVLITVGSTSFDQLIEAVDSKEFVSWFKKRGFAGLHIQKGRGKYELKLVLSELKDYDVQVFEYKNSLNEEITRASLIIGHAGAGTILDTLEAGKPLFVVPNSSLMNNHQAELAEELNEGHYLWCSHISHLIQELEKITCDSRLKEFPASETPALQLLLKGLF